MLIALLADIHGNRWALEAVLEDISRRSVDAVFNLGDSLYGPLDPAGTAELLMSLELINVRGNQDRVLLDPPHELNPPPTFRFVDERLSPAHRAWLASQPASLTVFAELLLCHGTPTADDRYLLEAVAADGNVHLRPGDDIASELTTISEPIVLCGHSHMPRAVRTTRHWIVNPGSVGLPAYSDDTPSPHIMETGSPHARYAVLRKRSRQWEVDHVALAYDWPAAAAAAEAQGRADWGGWLRTGRG